MLYGEIIAVCSEIHTKHINTLCGQNVELLNVKLVVHIVTTGILIETSSEEALAISIQWVTRSALFKTFPKRQLPRLMFCHRSLNLNCGTERYIWPRPLCARSFKLHYFFIAL
jgi:hypothetical protein